MLKTGLAQAEARVSVNWGSKSSWVEWGWGPYKISCKDWEAQRTRELQGLPPALLLGCTGVGRLKVSLFHSLTRSLIP